MNKIKNPTKQNVANALTLKGTATVWDYFRHTVMGCLTDENYSVQYHTYKGYRYITVTAR